MGQEHRWSELSRLQLGRYAEYFVKMEFTLHGFDVYSAEVDDKGIDFVIRKHPSKILRCPGQIGEKPSIHFPAERQVHSL